VAISDLAANNNSKNIKLVEGVVGGREVPAGGFLSASLNSLFIEHLFVIIISKYL
jgi:hypothetical protein